MLKVVVVLGYHCAPVEEVPVVKEYLDAVAEDIRKLDPGLVILCGGPTFQKSFPGVTEAWRMGEYLQKQAGPFMMALEEGSFTTYDNIKGAAYFINESKWPGVGLKGMDITLWCEATRALKVAKLARRLIGFPPANGGPAIKIKTSSWELMDPDKELVATVKDFLACYFPFLNTIQRFFRIRAAKRR